MKLATTTLGCPGWDLPTVLSRIKSYGYDGIDFRGLHGRLDLAALPEFTTDLRETAVCLRDAGLVVAGISSSISICDPARRAANLEEARRLIPIAQALGAANLRVFGNGPVPEIGRAAAAEVGRETMEQLLGLDGAGSIRWNIETHDHWSKAADVKLILDALPQANVGALWDVGLTAKAGESPDESFALIGSRTTYAHVKDAVHEPGHPRAGEGGWRYVLPGTGQLPLAETIALLRSAGFDGWLMFEHEKHWHPDLEEPEQAFPAFVAWFRSLHNAAD